MPYEKNQPPSASVSIEMRDASGAFVSGTPTVTVSKDGAGYAPHAGALAPISGTTGEWEYTASQDETNAGKFKVKAVLSGAVDATREVITESSYTAQRAGYLDALSGIVGAIASGVWGAALAGFTTLGTFGKFLQDQLDVKASTRLAASGYTPPPSDYQQRGQAVTLPEGVASSANVTAARDAILTAIEGLPEGVDLSPVLQAIDALGTPQQTGQAVTLPNPAPEGYGGGESGGSGGYGADDRARDEQTAAAVGALGGLPVSRVSPLGAGGAITVRRGIVYSVQGGDAVGPFEFSQNLTGATVELHDPYDGVVGTAVVTPPSTPGGKWSVSFEIAADTFKRVGTRAYFIAARYTGYGTTYTPGYVASDGLHERLSGPITVL